MYAQGRQRKGEGSEAEQRGRNAPRVSAYRLSVIYFPKFENYTAFNTAAGRRSSSVFYSCRNK